MSVRGGTEREFEKARGRARGRLRALLGTLTEAGVRDAHAWPRPFDASPTSARYAIGLGANPPDAAMCIRDRGRGRLGGVRGGPLAPVTRPDIRAR